MHYTVYVDESGDLGLDKVRADHNDRGASPFLTLGACLIPESVIPQMQKLQEDLTAEFGKELHCQSLNHFQVAKFANSTSKVKKIRLFGMVSAKRTLREYKASIAGSNQDQSYYNKCVQILLEQVGRFAGEFSIDSSNISIVMERREKHDYGRLRRFIKTIQGAPLDPRSAKYLKNIDPFSIRSEGKGSDRLLAFSDLVAHAVYQSVNQSQVNYGIPEQRYLRELRPLFYSDPKTGKLLYFGLNMMKLYEMGLSEQSIRFFKKLSVNSSKENKQA